ncbi:MAG: 50S ribosomal protein L31e [Nitrososphaera sp.]
MATVDNLTRVYTINLGRAWLTPQHKRTDRVVNMIREFAQKHMKSDEIKLEQELNRQIWSRGKTNPPRNVRVKMVKDEDGVVTVSLYEDTPEVAVEEKKPEPAAEAPAAVEEPKPEESKAQVKPASADK